MVRNIIPILVVALCGLITPASAVVSEYSLLATLRGEIGARGEYRFSAIAGEIVMSEASTGRTICAIRQPDSATVTFTATIASFGHLSAESSASIADRVTAFNVFSPIGTLALDTATGNLLLEHYVSSRLVSPRGIATAAIAFADIARRERRAFGAQP